MKRLVTAAAALFLGSCATLPPLPAAAGATFDPIAFFTGRSHGEGTLDKLIGSTVRVSVDSVGRQEGGTLILDQTIREGDEEPRSRRWTMRKVGPNRYTGTLTDARGPVEVTTEGPRANIDYETQDGLRVKQQLALQADGRTLLNRLSARKFGFAVARLDETIRKVD